MANSFYFYDLETSGISPRRDRIMQFGGQRTNLDLEPIGQPDNILIKLDDDILPQPDAILTHGITPQKTRAEGISEREFLNFFTDKIVQKGTIFVGYNNIRFDDEFVRFALWRNFFDAYEWQWRLECSRWDLLDVARMTRALRPTGINWPFAPDGKPTVSLGSLAAINKLEHDNAHDALSDVRASIAMARLIKAKQPKLFAYLLKMRDKNKVEMLINAEKPIIYTSGRYPSEYQKTAIATMVGPRADRPGALMYDLRIDPRKFIGLETAELARLWAARGEEADYFPVKVLSYNRCPAVAPINTLDDKTIKNLKLNMSQIEKHQQILAAATSFSERLNKALEIMHPPRQPKLVWDIGDVDSALYDGFVSPSDKDNLRVVRAADAQSINKLTLDFDDERLPLLFKLYKARNFPTCLSPQEINDWEKYRARQLLAGNPSNADRLFRRIEELADQSLIGNRQRAILKELELYARSILPRT